MYLHREKTRDALASRRHLEKFRDTQVSQYETRSPILETPGSLKIFRVSPNETPSRSETPGCLTFVTSPIII